MSASVHKLPARMPGLREFLETVFHTKEPDARPWFGLAQRAAGFPKLSALEAASTGRAVYFSTCSHKPVPWLDEYDDHPDRKKRIDANTYKYEKAGEPVCVRRRIEDNLQQMHLFVLDDIGTKFEANDVEPTYKIASSEGNEQWGYVLKTPLEIGDADALLARIKARGDLGDGGALTCPRLVRLPAGINGKDLGGSVNEFKVRLTTWNPDNLFTPEQLIDAWDLPEATAKVRQEKADPATRERIEEHPVYRKLVDMGAVQGQDGNKVFIECPWEGDHSDGVNEQLRDTMVVFDADGGFGFNCLHEHAHLGTDGATHSMFCDWLEENGLEVDRYGSEPASADDFPDLDEDDELPGLDEVAVEDVEEVKTPFPGPPGRVGLLAGEIRRNLIRPQPSYAIATALVVTSTATQNRFVTGLMGTGLNLYSAQVGPTSAGKDGPRSEAKHLLQQIGFGNAFPEGISSGAALIRAAADDKSILYLPDELGMLLQVALSESGPAHQKDLIAEIMRFYTLARGTHGGKRYAKSSDTIAPIKRPFVCMLGSSTPTEMAKALNQGHVENGLLNRILYTEADQELPRKSRDGRPGYSAPLVMWLQSLTGNPGTLDLDLDDDIDQEMPDKLKLKDGEIPFTAEAEQLFDAFDQESDQNSVSGELGPLWNRAHENALRVAGIVALGMDTVQVDREVAQWAVGYVRHSVELMVRYVEENVAESKFDEQCKRAMRFMRNVKSYGSDKRFGVACRKGLMPRGKLTKLLKLQSRDVDQILEYLLVTKQIREEKVKLDDSQKETTLYRVTEV